MYLQNEGVSRHETLQLFLLLFPLQHMKRPALQNKQVVLLRMAFRDRKVLGTFEKQGPGVLETREQKHLFLGNSLSGCWNQGNTILLSLIFLLLCIEGKTSKKAWDQGNSEKVFGIKGT